MNSQPYFATRIITIVATGALALGSLFTSGCAARSHVSYVSNTDDSPALATKGNVEVLLDRAPDGAHIVTGDLFAQTVSNTASIALMRDKARAAGLDGIYWVDCTSTCSGRCSAKGYVYVDRNLAKSAKTAVASER